MFMGKFTLPEVPYAYDALEPHVDARTMEIHHTKHHQAYTNGLNDNWEKLPADMQSKDLLDVLANISSVPEAVRGAINFHGGGYDNHRLFWNNMKQNGGAPQEERSEMQSTKHLEISIRSKNSFPQKPSQFKVAVGVG